jgi:hypothetical protein
MSDSQLEPSRPTYVSNYAEACLQALAASGLGDKLSLGGAFGLLHYMPGGSRRPRKRTAVRWLK